MASNIGNHNITEYNIAVGIESEDGRLRVHSNGKGLASINMTVDRGAVGALSAIKLNPLAITFPAEIPEDMLETVGVSKYAEMAQKMYPIGKATPIPINSITIDKVPGSPLDLTTEYFDVNVEDDQGQLMVATLLANGTLVGDIDVGQSSYDNSTGKLVLIWNRPLKQGQTVKYIKNFTSPPATPTTFTLTDLVPYRTVTHHVLAAKTFDDRLNTHIPVAPGTVLICATRYDMAMMEVRDDGEGALTGDVDKSGSNYINYDTGEISVTFKDALCAGSPIMVKHASLVKIKEYRQNSKAMTRLKILLPWEDLARIVKSVEQAADVAENGLKYRANT